MKWVLAAGFAIALGAVLLNFRSTRNRPGLAGAGTPQDPAPLTAPDPGRGPVPFADRIAKATKTDSLPDNLPRANSIVTLNVQGLAPVMLTGQNGAPSENTLVAITGRTDLSDAAKARSLIQMLPGLPPEVLARAAEEAATRMPDSDYGAAFGPTLIDPQTHGVAMSVLFADLMERPPAITLPILVSIAQNPKHPYSLNARDNLQFVLRQDFGNDWAGWNEAIRKRLSASEK